MTTTPLEPIIKKDDEGAKIDQILNFLHAEDPNSTAVATEKIGAESFGAQKIVTMNPLHQDGILASSAESVLPVSSDEQRHVLPDVEVPDFSGGGHGVFKKVLGVLAAVLPYVVVFAVGVGAYYLFLADESNRISISQIFNRNDQGVVGGKEVKTSQVDLLKDLKAAQESMSADYEAWIGQFFFAVTDQSRVDMETIAPNGLTNFENYLLKLNPKSFDANANGQADALDVLSGMNPETGEPLSIAQRDVVAKFFNAEKIRARLNQPSLQQKEIPKISGMGLNIRGAGTAFAADIGQPFEGRVAGAATQTQPSIIPNSSSGEKPAVVLSTAQIQGNLKINTKIPGRLEIPSIGVNVPIIWTSNIKNFDDDLKKGVVHHPETPLPGDVGTAYISGHSSNYAWVKADFNKVLAKLGQLPIGATFKVTVVNDRGRDVRLYYMVESKKEFVSSDQSQFANFAQSRVAISTCWPIGSIKNRLVAFGILERIEEQ